MALERGEESASRPGRSLPPENTQYPLYRRLSGPQGRSGQVRKISFPPGFDLRTVQPVASRYTDYATQPPVVKVILLNSFKYIYVVVIMSDCFAEWRILYASCVFMFVCPWHAWYPWWVVLYNFSCKNVQKIPCVRLPCTWKTLSAGLLRRE